MMTMTLDNGPHREMAVDVPDSFIASSKTPPRYPPPRAQGRLQVHNHLKLTAVWQFLQMWQFTVVMVVLADVVGYCSYGSSCRRGRLLQLWQFLQTWQFTVAMVVLADVVVYCSYGSSCRRGRLLQLWQFLQTWQVTVVMVVLADVVGYCSCGSSASYKSNCHSESPVSGLAPDSNLGLQHSLPQWPHTL